ncbi:extracellular solute-binding protein [Candidatus Woesebacteria bacterium]|nr:MAG: extracellular solute-binding protein [Candidatus Woesebacteria bacterium]
MQNQNTTTGQSQQPNLSQNVGGDQSLNTASTNVQPLYKSNIDINPSNLSNTNMQKPNETKTQEPSLFKNKDLLGVFNSGSTSSATNKTDLKGNNANQDFVGKKKKKPPVLIIFAIFLLVIVGLLFAILLTKNRGTEETTEPTDTEGEIVWWGLEDANIYKSVITKFESENKNTKITYIQQSPDNYRERLTNSLAKGSGPDVFAYHNSWVPMFRGELDIMPSFVMGAQEFADTYYPIIAADLTRSDGVVGLPLEYDGLVLYMNEDIFASAGKSPPVTWDEFRNLARELTQKDKQGNIIQSGVSLGPTQNMDHWQELIAFMIFQNHGTPSNPGSSEASEALAYYIKLKNDGNWSDLLPQSTVAFANGQVAMYFGTTKSVTAIVKTNPDLNFKSIPLPQLRRDDPLEPDLSYASYWVQGVWKRSLSRGVAWRFLDFISQPDNLEDVNDQSVAINKVGKPYPIVNMAQLLKNDMFSANLINLAPFARSWYLADMTYDGNTGINAQFADLYEPIINDKGLSNMDTFTVKVNDVLVRFGLTK